jgi:hypothetical protein
MLSRVPDGGTPSGTLGVVADPARWPARRSRGGDAAIWAAALLLFLALAALVFGGSREPGAGMVLLVVTAVVLAAAGTLLLVWAIAYQRLAYALTDSALRIQWLGRTTVVPYGAIQGIYTGQRLAGRATPEVPRWPGINVGPARVRGLGRLRFFATSTDQAELTFITVSHGGIIISAADPNGFRAALIERVEQAPEDNRLVWQQMPPTIRPWTALADVWLLLSAAAGTVALVAVLAVIALRFDALPDATVLHFDANGTPNQIAAKSDLLRLPLFGLLCLLLNWMVGLWIHPRETVLARLLWSGGAVVQVVLLIGVLRLVS